METEHRIEREASGGAMSVKLISWSEPLTVTPNHPDVVERSVRILRRLCHEAGVHEPPVMEWRFNTNLMQSFTGDKEELFDKVTSHEYKQQVYEASPELWFLD